MNLKKYKKCVEEIDSEKLEELKELISEFDNIIILGNGGSNAISCHIAEDYTKVLGKKAMCFGDSARMSCYANDYGWDNAYSKYIEHFAESDSLVILISSSGNSRNIINAASYCEKNKIPIITMSGFSEDNNLKFSFEKRSLLHFWVDSKDYGIVECLHELILHSVL
jgi:D-sedoheptulose 7-phosphate isomerase